MLNNNFKKQGGFTLVEMLVSIAIFMIVMTVAVGSLISIVSANKKAQAIKNVINNVNLALESVSKNMRMGTQYFCSIDGGVEYVGNCGEGTDGGNAIKYTSNEDQNVVYYRYEKNPNEGEGNIQRCTDVTGMEPEFCGPVVNNWQSITAPTSTLRITNMKFYVFGTGTKFSPVGSKKQPRVVITIDGSAGSQDITKTTFNLQTTVSQRNRE